MHFLLFVNCLHLTYKITAWFSLSFVNCYLLFSRIAFTHRSFYRFICLRSVRFEISQVPISLFNIFFSAFNVRVLNKLSVKITYVNQLNFHMILLYLIKRINVCVFFFNMISFIIIILNCCCFSSAHTNERW